jgi:hypothetical protein
MHAIGINSSASATLRRRALYSELFSVDDAMEALVNGGRKLARLYVASLENEKVSKTMVEARQRVEDMGFTPATIRLASINNELAFEDVEGKLKLLDEPGRLDSPPPSFLSPSSNNDVNDASAHDQYHGEGTTAAAAGVENDDAEPEDEEQRVQEMLDDLHTTAQKMREEREQQHQGDRNLTPSALNTVKALMKMCELGKASRVLSLLRGLKSKDSRAAQREAHQSVIDAFKEDLLRCCRNRAETVHVERVLQRTSQVRPFAHPIEALMRLPTVRRIMQIELASVQNQRHAVQMLVVLPRHCGAASGLDGGVGLTRVAHALGELDNRMRHGLSVCGLCAGNELAHPSSQKAAGL